MRYTRKTRDEYEILGNYGYGWDVLTTEDNHKDAKNMLKCYNENEPMVPHMIKKRRIRIKED